MAFTKITNTELNSRGATTLADQPNISAALLKQEFDAPAKEVVAPKFNNLIDELEATSAAASLGAAAPTGRSGETVQAVLNDLSGDLAAVESEIGTAIQDAHTHDNKALLDSYNQSNADIADAVSKRHAHSNKSLLDSYNQSNADIADAVSKKHSHGNKSLLDTYTQTESNLADAVSKKHSHSNKAVLDKFGESSGQPTYDGNPIGGGGAADAYKTITVGSTDIVASGEDRLTLVAGSNVTLTPDASGKSVTIASSGGGGGGGSVNNAYKNIKVGTSTITASGEDTFELEAGSNVTLTPDVSGKKVTIAATGGSGGSSDAYKTVKVGSTNIVASGADTIEIEAGTNITLTADASNKKVTINSVIPLVSIAVTTEPTKTEYSPGETLDLTGLVVTATYLDNTTKVVTNDCTYSPASGATLSTSDTSVTITYTEAGVTKTTSFVIDVAFRIYGVEWDGTASTSLTRTDLAANFTDPVPQMSDGNGGWTTGSSPFDTIKPWSGMVRRSHSDAGALVEIPKFYYKLDYADTVNNTGLKIQISPTYIEGYKVSPAHMDRGDGVGERNVIYVGRYHCASTYKSTTGVAPKTNIYRSTARTSIHNLGSTIWQWDFATRFTIWLLYLVEFANWNSQACIGMGCGNNTSAANNGATDSMTYHTGTTLTNRTTFGGSTQYRYIEGLWDNAYDWLDGCYYSSGFRVILNPTNFSDSENGVSVGLPDSGSLGAVSAFNISDTTGAFKTFYVKSSTNSNTTYVCDQWKYASNKPCLFTGGYYGQLEYVGLFYIDSVTATTKDARYGCRLMKLPNS